MATRLVVRETSYRHPVQHDPQYVRVKAVRDNPYESVIYDLRTNVENLRIPTVGDELCIHVDGDPDDAHVRGLALTAVALAKALDTGDAHTIREAAVVAQQMLATAIDMGFPRTWDAYLRSLDADSRALARRAMSGAYRLPPAV